MRHSGHRHIAYICQWTTHSAHMRSYGLPDRLLRTRTRRWNSYREAGHSKRRTLWINAIYQSIHFPTSQRDAGKTNLSFRREVHLHHSTPWNDSRGSEKERPSRQTARRPHGSHADTDRLSPAPPANLKLPYSCSNTPTPISPTGIKWKLNGQRIFGDNYFFVILHQNRPVDHPAALPGSSAAFRNSICNRFSIFNKSYYLLK